MKPKVIVAPEFRRMDEIFDPPTLERLHDLVDVQWGRDGPMPQEAFMAALQDATAVVFGTWRYGSDAIPNAGSSLRYVFEVAGGHGHVDLNGRLGNIPVQMVGSIAHQLIGGRVIDIAPSFDNTPVPPMLHHWIDGDIVSGYYPWPADVDAERIDRSSNMAWEDLKDLMRGSMK